MLAWVAGFSRVAAAPPQERSERMRRQVDRLITTG